MQPQLHAPTPPDPVSLTEETAATRALPHGAPLAYHANGYLGQYLVVVPAARLVAVRQIRNSDGYDPKTDGFEDFPARVARMARAGRAIK